MSGQKRNWPRLLMVRDNILLSTVGTLDGVGQC